jgi:rod shape-determining protein MreC
MLKKSRKKKISILLTVVAVSLGLIFLTPESLVRPFRRVVIAVSYPLEKIAALLSYRVKNTAGFLGSISDLRNENERLIRENNSLFAKNATLLSVQKENDELRSQLGLIPKNKYSLAAAFVIGHDSERSGTWMTVDKGSGAGVAPGMPAIVSDGILAGRVGEAADTSAKVNLLTSPESVINVLDLESGAKGVVRGDFGLGIIMDLVTQEDVVNVGDTLVTSGLGSNMPKGLLVGTVQEVRSTQDKLFQQALITPRVPFRDIDVMFIITKTNE